MTGLSNPKDILFFVSFFPQFIAVTRDFTTSILTLCLVWVIFDFAILTLYILTVKKMDARQTWQEIRNDIVAFFACRGGMRDRL